MRTLTKRGKKNKIPPYLKPLGIITKVPRQPKCTVASCFTDKTVFAYRDADFDNWLPKTLPASKQVSVKGYELMETTTEVALIKVGRPFTNLTQIEDLILRTERGENTGLITNGYANLFFLKVGNSVFTVHAYRHPDGWDVSLARFGPRYGWVAEHRFFSPAT